MVSIRGDALEAGVLRSGVGSALTETAELRDLIEGAEGADGDARVTQPAAR